MQLPIMPAAISARNRRHRERGGRFVEILLPAQLRRDADDQAANDGQHFGPPSRVVGDRLIALRHLTPIVISDSRVQRDDGRAVQICQFLPEGIAIGAGVCQHRLGVEIEVTGHLAGIIALATGQPVAEAMYVNGGAGSGNRTRV